VLAWRQRQEAAVLTHFGQFPRILDLLDQQAAADLARLPTDAPHLNRREASAVTFLLDTMDKYGVHCPQREDPATEAARANGWGLGPSPAGWNHVALARLRDYGCGDVDADTDDPLFAPRQPHPFARDGLIGPWPQGWVRMAWESFRSRLPPP
jgi:hypothetical protein